MADEADHEIITISSDEESSKPQVSVSTKRPNVTSHSLTKKNKQYFNISSPKTMKSVQTSNSNVSKAITTYANSSQTLSAQSSCIDSHKRRIRDTGAINVQPSLNKFKQTVQSSAKPASSTSWKSTKCVTSTSQHSSNLQLNKSVAHSQRHVNNRNLISTEKANRNQSTLSVVVDSQAKFPSHFTKASSCVSGSNTKLVSTQNREQVSAVNTRASKLNCSGAIQISNASSSSSKSKNCSFVSQNRKDNKDKSIVPSHVLNALEEKGISVTNIITVSDSGHTYESSNKKESESQQFVDKIRYSLKGNGTSLKTVSQSKDSLSSNRHVAQNSSISQKNIYGKRKAETRNVTSQNKLSCIRTSAVVPLSNVLTNSKNDLSCKINSQLNIISKPSFENSICLTNKTTKNVQTSSQIKSNSISVQKTVQKPDISKIVSNKVMSTQKVTDAFKQISSKSLTIIPVHDLTDSSSDRNDIVRKHLDSSRIQQQKLLSSMQTTAGDKTRKVLCPKDVNNSITTTPSAVILPCNPSLSIKAINCVEKLLLNNSESVIKSEKKFEKEHVPSNSGKEMNSSSTVSNVLCKKIDVSKDRNALLSIIASSNSTNVPTSNKEDKHSKLITVNAKDSVNGLNSVSLVPPKDTIVIIPVGNKSVNDKNELKQEVDGKNGFINQSGKGPSISSVCADVTIICNKSDTEVTKTDLPAALTVSDSGKRAAVSISSDKCDISFVLPEGTLISACTKSVSEKTKSEQKVDLMVTDSVKGPVMSVSPNEPAVLTISPTATTTVSVCSKSVGENSLSDKTIDLIVNDSLNASVISVSSVESVISAVPPVDALVTYRCKSISEETISDPTVNISINPTIPLSSNELSISPVPLINVIGGTSSRSFNETTKCNQIVDLTDSDISESLTDSVKAPLPSSGKLLSINSKSMKLCKKRKRVLNAHKEIKSNKKYLAKNLNHSGFSANWPKPIVLLERIDPRSLSAYLGESIAEKENDLVEAVHQNCCLPKIKNYHISECESPCNSSKEFYVKEAVVLLEKIFISSDGRLDLNLNENTDRKPHEKSETLLITEKVSDFISDEIEPAQIYENVHKKSTKFGNKDLNKSVSTIQTNVNRTINYSPNDKSCKVDMSHKVLDRQCTDVKTIFNSDCNLVVLSEVSENSENNHVNYATSTVENTSHSLTTEAVSCIEISNEKCQGSVHLPGFQKRAEESQFNEVESNVIITPENSQSNSITHSSICIASYDSLVIAAENNVGTSFRNSKICKSGNDLLNIESMSNGKQHENSQICSIYLPSNNKTLDNSLFTETIVTNSENSKFYPIYSNKVVNRTDVTHSVEIIPENCADQSQILSKCKAVNSSLKYKSGRSIEISSENCHNKSAQLSDALDDSFSAKSLCNVNIKSDTSFKLMHLFEIQKVVDDLLNKVTSSRGISSENFQDHSADNRTISNINMNLGNYQHQSVLSSEVHKIVNDLLDSVVISNAKNYHNHSTSFSETCKNGKHSFKTETLNNIQINSGILQDSSVLSRESNSNMNYPVDSRVLNADNTLNDADINFENNQGYCVTSNICEANVNSVGMETINNKGVGLENSQKLSAFNIDTCTTVDDSLNIQAISKLKASENSGECPIPETFKTVNSMLIAGDEYSIGVNPENSQEKTVNSSEIYNADNDVCKDRVVNNTMTNFKNFHVYPTHSFETFEDVIVEDSLNSICNIENNPENSHNDPVHSSESFKAVNTVLDLKDMCNEEQNLDYLVHMSKTVNDLQNTGKVSCVEISLANSDPKSTHFSETCKSIDNSLSSGIVYNKNICSEKSQAASLYSRETCKTAKGSINIGSKNNDKLNPENSHVNMTFPSEICKLKDVSPHSEVLSDVAVIFKNSLHCSVQHSEVCKGNCNLTTARNQNSINISPETLKVCSVCPSEINEADLVNAKTLKDQSNSEMAIIEDALNNIISYVENKCSVSYKSNDSDRFRLSGEFCAGMSVSKTFDGYFTRNKQELLDFPLLYGKSKTITREEEKMNLESISECKINKNDNFSDLCKETLNTKTQDHLRFLLNTSEKPFDCNLFAQNLHMKAFSVKEVEMKTIESSDNFDKFCFPLQKISEIQNEKVLCSDATAKQITESNSVITEDICMTPVLIMTNSFDDRDNSIDQNVVNDNVSNILAQLETIDPNEISNVKHSFSQDSLVLSPSPLICSTLKLSSASEKKTYAGVSEGKMCHIIENEPYENKTSVEIDVCIEDFNSSSVSHNNLLPFNESEMQLDLSKDIEMLKETKMSDVKTFPVDEWQDVSDTYNNLHKEGEKRNSPLKEELLAEQMITSPKLSLKRNRTVASPDSKLSDTQQNGYFSDNNCKKVKVNHLSTVNHVPSPKQVEHILEKKTPVPSIPASREDANKRKFLELLEFSKSLMDKTPEMEKAKISKNMMRQLESTEQCYVASEKFTSLLESSYSEMKGKSSLHKENEEVFIILSRLRKELKKYKVKRNSFKIDSSEDTNTSPLPSNSKDCTLEGKKVDIFPVSLASGLLKTTSEVTISSGINGKKYSVDSVSELCSATSEISKSSINKDNTEMEVCNLSNDVTTVALLSTSENTSCLIKDSFINERTIALNPTIFTSELPASKTVKSCNIGMEIVPSPVSSTSEFLTNLESAILSTHTYSDKQESRPDLESVSLAVIPSSSISETEKYFPKEWIIGGKKYSSFGVVSSNLLSSVSEKEKLNSNATSNFTPSSSSSSLKSENINQSSKHSLSNSEVIENCDKSDFKSDRFFINASKLVTENKVNETLSKLDAFSQNKKSAKQTNAARIKRLEKELAKLDKKIKKLKTEELTLEDLEKSNSAYILEDAYIRRFNKIWKTLCKLTEQTSKTGRLVEKKFAYAGSRYSGINEAVQKMVNKRKVAEKFPNYVEILDLVKKVNELRDIGLSQRDVEIEAERIFRDVGRELQLRRTHDHEELFGCYLTDNFDPNTDPAEHDEQLKKVLTDSYNKFENSVSELIDKYAERQKEVNEVSEDGENEQNSSGEDEEEEPSKVEEEVDRLTDVASPLSGGSPNIINRGLSSDNDVIEIPYDSEKSTEPNDNVDDVDMNKLAENSSKNHKFRNNNESKYSEIHLHEDTKPQECSFKISSVEDIKDKNSSDTYTHKDIEKGECSFKIPPCTDIKQAESSSHIYEPKNSENSVSNDMIIIDDSDSSNDLPSLQDLINEES